MKTRHHRKCKFLGGSDKKENISIVPNNKHKAFHLLFNHQHTMGIARILNETWIDPYFELVVRVRK